MSTTRNPLSELTKEQREVLMRRLGRVPKKPQGENRVVVPSLVPVSRSRDLPLSFSQQRMWFVDQLTPGNGSYNVPLSLHLRGNLNIVALEGSLAELIRRHEALRTCFIEVEGKPMQKICTDCQWEMEQLDCTSVEEKAVLSMLTERGQRPWNLREAPLLRATLIKLREQEHVLLLVMHHIVMDGWSCGVLIKDLMAIYEAFVSGKTSPLAELKIQYGDFAYWQRSWLQGAALEAEMGYWRKQLEGAPDLLELPLDHPRPKVPRHRGSRVTASIMGETVIAIKELARKEGVTTFMVMLAVFQLLLARHSGQNDICVGTPIANRTRRELEDIVGIFINMLVLRTDLSGDPIVRELLARVREVCVGAYAHQDMPFEKLVEEMGPERSLQHSPLFQVIFVAQHAPFEPVRMDQVELNFYPFDKGVTRYDLECHFLEGDRQINLRILYNSDVFEHSTAERLLSRFCRLLKASVSAPDRRISELDVLDEEERKRVLALCSGPHVDYAGTSLVHQLFEQQVERTPQAIAAVCGEATLTYAELNSKANQLARHLRSIDIGPEVSVGLHCAIGLDALIAMLGVLKSGGAYVPLDPSFPAERIKYVLGEIKAPVVLCQDYDPVLEDFGATLLPLKSLLQKVSANDATNLTESAHPENLAYVIYTSGSTGRPKGVCITHAGFNNYVRWASSGYPVSKGTGSLVHSPLSFDLTLTGIFPILIAGKAVEVLVPPAGLDQLAQTLQDGKERSLVKITPSHLKILGELCSDSTPSATACFVIGGEAFTYEDLASCRRLFPQARWFNEYGPTETVVGCCVYELYAINASRVVSIGLPIANTQLYVCDARFQLVPAGTPGQLCIAGNSLGRGYFQKPELTAEKWAPNPFGSPGERMYLSGDLARQLSDGRFEFLGRMDHQVKIRGFRVEPGEIESLIKQHATVRDAAVIAREDNPGVKQLAAYVVPVAELDASEAEDFISGLRSYLQLQLPEYMIPTGFTLLRELPLTANGKLDSKTLPEITSRSSAKVFKAPETEVEQTIARMWQELLRVSEPGINDNFFELGGSSILAVQLQGQLNRVFGLDLQVADIFQFSSIAALAEYIGGGIRRLEIKPPSQNDLSERSMKKRAAVTSWKDHRQQ
jgi:amino acid adenylation domain-containing protein